LDPPEIITKKVKAAVTDSGRDVTAGPDKPALTNLLTIFSLVTGAPVPDIEARFDGAGYGAFKADLADAIAEHLAPVRARHAELTQDPAELERLLAAGADRAAAVAAPTIGAVWDAVGLRPRRG
jgi:tryptophanyl-tRNA synthetase